MYAYYNVSSRLLPFMSLWWLSAFLYSAHLSLLPLPPCASLKLPSHLLPHAALEPCETANEEALQQYSKTAHERA